MGLYTLLFFGMMPIGALLVGVAADAMGEAMAIRAGAAVLGVFALVVLVRFPSVRRLG